MNEREENYTDILNIFKQRQNVRSHLKAVCESLISDQSELNNLGSQKFAQDLQALNQIAEKAEYTRELQLDAIGLKHLSAAAKNQALRLNDLSRRYGFDALAEQLAFFRHQGKQTLDWTAVGMATMTMVGLIPAQDTMLGAVDKTVKQRKQGVRNKRAQDEENDHLIDMNLASKPTEQTSADAVEVDDSAALKRSALQLEYLRKIAGNDGHSVDLLDLLVDPSDAVQTIENFFDFSFLLKDKKVAEGRDSKNGLPKVVIADPNTIDAADKKQMILAVNMGDLEHLLEEMRKHGGGNADVHPFHRTSELYQCDTLQEQVQCLENQAHKRQRR